MAGGCVMLGWRVGRVYWQELDEVFTILKDMGSLERFSRLFRSGCKQYAMVQLRHKLTNRVHREYRLEETV